MHVGFYVVHIIASHKAKHDPQKHKNELLIPY